MSYSVIVCWSYGVPVTFYSLHLHKIFVKLVNMVSDPFPIEFTAMTTWLYGTPAAVNVENMRSSLYIATREIKYTAETL